MSYQNADTRKLDQVMPGIKVIGPTGKPMTLADLPAPGTKRWGVRRKAEVVAGVRAGLISLNEACERYSLSIDEFLLWQRQFDSHGLEGLKVTRIANYRQPAQSNDTPGSAKAAE